MRTLVFLLEEPSAKALLEGLLPVLMPDGWDSQCLVFEGKQDLERRMVSRMRGWIRPQTRFLVLRDQDSGDCRRIKSALLERCRASGREDAVVRIACRDLESFFVGDWRAVAEAFKLPQLADLARKAKYRNPDQLGSPAELLRRHVPGYQKLEGARRIAPYLTRDRNASRSFRALVDGILSCFAADTRGHAPR